MIPTWASGMRMSQHLLPLLVWGLSGGTPVIAAQAEAGAVLDTRPLQVVRVTLANPTGLRQAITASLGGCAAKLNIPVPPIPPKLTDAGAPRLGLRRRA